MTLPDTRRLLQTVLTVAVAGDPVKHDLALSDWRQAQRDGTTRATRRRGPLPTENDGGPEPEGRVGRLRDP